MINNFNFLLDDRTRIIDSRRLEYDRRLNVIMPVYEYEKNDKEEEEDES